MSTYKKIPKEVKRYYERELRQYWKNKSLLNKFEDKKLHSRQILFLEERIESIENVIKRLTPFEQEVFELIFKENIDWLYAKTMNGIDKNTYYNIMNKAIYMLAEEVGEI